MQMRIHIHMDNAAFDEQPLAEVARILELEAARMRRFGDQREWSSTLRDVNGNSVGSAQTTKET